MPIDPSPYRILIVDDDIDLCESFGELLNDRKHQHRAAQTVQQARKLVAEFRPHVIVCDIRLGGESGIKAIQQFKIIRPTARIIVLTGYATMNNAVESLRLGIFDYLTKPLHPEDLFAKLDKCFHQLELETAHHHAVNALKESELRQRTVIQNALDGILTLNEDSKIDSVNPAAEDLFEYTSAELIGRNIDFLLSIKFPDLTAKLKSMDIQRGSRFELSGKCKSGRNFPIDVSISRICSDANISYMCIVRDITERKKTEEAAQKYQDRLESLVKIRTSELEASMAELESFTYSVSHDLRAPLRHIHGFSQILLEDYIDSLEPACISYLQRICGAVDKMDTLINDLLSLSRASQSEVQGKSVDLSELATEVANELHHQSTLKVHTEIQANLRTYGDPNLLRIALYNLLGNAWKFTSKQTEPVVSFGAQHNNDQTVFYVRDNGAGFDMRYAGKLFSPFQRLHHENDYQGTGIGLAIVKRIINRHEGKVWAESSPDRGSVFYFTLHLDKKLDSQEEYRNYLRQGPVKT